MTEITYRDLVALPEIAIVIRLILIFVRLAGYTSTLAGQVFTALSVGR